LQFSIIITGAWPLGASNYQLAFGGDADHDLYPGILRTFVCSIGNCKYFVIICYVLAL